MNTYVKAWAVCGDSVVLTCKSRSVLKVGARMMRGLLNRVMLSSWDSTHTGRVAVSPMRQLNLSDIRVHRGSTVCM